MLHILYYCLKVIICSMAFWGYYRLALHNSRFHQWNRYYLLAAVLLSFALPLLRIPLPDQETAGSSTLIVKGVELMSVTDLYVTGLSDQQHFHFNWPILLGIAYIMVVVFLIVVFTRNIIKIQQLRKNYPCEFIEGVRFYNTREPGTPFSFFSTIFWNRKIDPESAKGRQMLRHELAHVHEKHSTDKVFMEMVIGLAWWNPFFYMLRKELSVIHEFIADQKAAAGDDNLEYASLLLMKAIGNDQFALANPFFHSQLKRRLHMLTTSKNPKYSYLRRLMVLPLFAMAILIFSFKYKEFHQEQPLKSAVPLTVIIDPGHGGDDNGAKAADGSNEDDIALQVAKQIKVLSEGTNIRVILTRETDKLPGNQATKEASLKYRTNLAREYKADMFISLHLNSAGEKNNSSFRGIESYVGSKNVTLQDKKSRMLASALLEAVADNGIPVLKEWKSRDEKGIWVLDHNSCPAVILMLGYLTNQQDLDFIKVAKNQALIAKDVLNALAAHGKQINELTAADQPENTQPVIPGGFFKDTLKLKKTGVKNPGKTRSYKGAAIVSIQATADTKGVVIVTHDQKTYFLDKDEAKKELDINVADYRLPSKTDWEKGMAQKRMDISIAPANPVRLRVMNSDTTKKPLYVVDGVKADEIVLKTMNPSDIQQIDVLKGEKALLLYGEGGKNGVIMITTKKYVPVTLKLEKVESAKPVIGADNN